MRNRIAAGLIALAIVVCTGIVPCSAQEDVELSALRFVGVFTAKTAGYLRFGETRVEVRKGEVLRHEVTEYNELDGTPDAIEVVTTVHNRGPRTVRNLLVRTAASAKVARLVFVPGMPGAGTDPATADHKATERTAAWFAPFALSNTTIAELPADNTVDVTLYSLTVQDFIRDYVSRKLWPIELRVEASVEAIGAEDNLSNNTQTRYLPFRIPPY